MPAPVGIRWQCRIATRRRSDGRDTGTTRATNPLGRGRRAGDQGSHHCPRSRDGAAARPTGRRAGRICQRQRRGRWCWASKTGHAVSPAYLLRIWTPRSASSRTRCRTRSHRHWMPISASWSCRVRRTRRLPCCASTCAGVCPSTRVRAGTCAGSAARSGRWSPNTWRGCSSCAAGHACATSAPRRSRAPPSMTSILAWWTGFGERSATTTGPRRC